MKLTQEEKRIKIAEARGWNKDRCLKLGDKEHWSYCKDGIGYAHHFTELPDYFNDLNALYGAWESLTDYQKTIFAGHIRRLHEGMDIRVFAAFRQHGAECIGLTLNLWEAGA